MRRFTFSCLLDILAASLTRRPRMRYRLTVLGLAAVLGMPPSQGRLILRILASHKGKGFLRSNGEVSRRGRLAGCSYLLQ